MDVVRFCRSRVNKWVFIFYHSILKQSERSSYRCQRGTRGGGGRMLQGRFFYILLFHFTKSQSECVPQSLGQHVFDLIIVIIHRHNNNNNNNNNNIITQPP
uniref:Uncharacterized protein n=1 Tax=Schizaphis graminum TaxID=13262 RepID=A0A2S2PLV5_SCHGA